ncbi:MAG: hypothetical protein WA134_06935, partial [Rhodoferax sp.]
MANVKIVSRTRRRCGTGSFKYASIEMNQRPRISDHHCCSTHKMNSRSSHCRPSPSARLLGQTAEP